jgi:glucose-1-phosphate adenylyltransferase
VRKLFVNTKDTGIQNFSMNIYIVNRELLIDLINNASIRGQQFFEREILLQNLDRLNVQGYKYDGYVSRVTGVKSYFDENMRLLDDHNLDALFSPAPIYTKIRDDNPTRYKNGSRVQNSMLADGCLIEGEVENSILFRGVKVAKGAKVKNCILMQDTVIESGASVEYLITDKQVTVTAGKEMKGTDTFPFYIAKQHTV